MSEDWFRPKPVTPSSLKVLIAVQGVAILLLGSWLYVEYQFAPTFRTVFNDVVFSRALMWAATIGLLTGLIASLAAFGLQRTSTRLRRRLETLQTALVEAAKMLQDKMPSTPTQETAKEQSGAIARVQPGSTSLLVVSKNP